LRVYPGGIVGVAAPTDVSGFGVRVSGFRKQGFGFGLGFQKTANEV